MKKLFSLIFIQNLATYETASAIRKPNTYSPIITSPLRLKKPSQESAGITRVIKMENTGKRALQLINGVMSRVSSRSFLFSMLRVLMMAGTAQANPLIMGITLLPLSPTFRISLSLKKLILAI